MEYYLIAAKKITTAANYNVYESLKTQYWVKGLESYKQYETLSIQFKNKTEAICIV